MGLNLQFICPTAVFSIGKCARRKQASASEGFLRYENHEGAERILDLVVAQNAC